VLSRVAVALLLSLTVRTARTASAADQPPLVFLGDRDYPPLSYLDHGVPKGLDVDIVRAVARALHRDVRIEPLDWREAQARALRGEADGLTELAMTEERRALYDFTDATAMHECGLFVRAGNATIHGVDDLAGKRVGVTPGGFLRQLMERRGDVDVVFVENYADGFERLAAGGIQALAADVWVAAYTIQTRAIQNIAIAGEPFATLTATIAVPKGHEALVADLNRAIASLKNDGTLARIQDQWRPQEMLFVSRERARRLVVSVVGVALALLFAMMALWVYTLKRQMGVRRSAEADLVEHRQRLELALVAAGMGAWRWDIATGLSTRDASLNRMLGLAAAESTQGLDDMFERIHPADRSAIRAELDRAVRERDTYATEYRIVRPDATVRWLRGRGRAFYGEDGQPSYVTGTTMDITEQREAEEALRGSEEKFAKAFQGSPDCIMITDAATDAILDVNDRFEDMMGYSRAEALGRTVVELELVDAAVRDEWFAAFRAAGAVRDCEFEVRRKDGRHATILMSADFLEIGGHKRVLTVHRDITDRKRSEEALQRSEAKYRELVENANDVVFTIDADGYCLSMNRIGRAISGFVSEDPRGTHLEALVVPEQIESAHRQLQRVLAGEEVPVFELVIASADGGRVTLETNVRPICDNGRVVAAQGIARDVTARKELEQQLRQAQKMDAIGRLAAGVAHDFNNLLTVILGNCEVAAPLLKPDDPIQNTLRDIRSAADRAAGLTTQLLAFSRRQLIQPRVLDVNETVAEIRRLLTRLIGEHIDFRFVPAADLWHVSADPGQLQQVIVNLGVNARDAMPEGGRLTIATRNVHFAQPHVERGAQVPAGDYVEISVADTGVGMEPDTLDRLFEPFYTTKEAGKGTGLGLATVYGIVKQSDGFVFVDSAPHEGSTFWILLPRADAPVTAAHVENVRDDSSGGHETVLLVEDEDDVRELIHDYLGSQGYTVVSASTGEEGVDLARGLARAPSLLISDIVMPGMNGRVLSDQLRASYPHLKVLYVSGYTDDALVRHTPLPPGTHFLQKPFALSTLAKKIRDIVDATEG
jgi:two-component system, cell cycle sensor histidine kinase and response regulator CckA